MPDDAPTGSVATKLVVIRGNSGAGKSTVARELRLRYGRGWALIEQDYLRRTLLRELDTPGGLAPALVEHTARFALDNGYHVIVEGILYTERYRDALTRLCRAHRGGTFVYYLDASFEETIRRHASRPQATQFSADDMRGWYHPADVLGLDGERVIPETSSIEETIALIATTVGLPLAPVAV